MTIFAARCVHVNAASVCVSVCVCQCVCDGIPTRTTPEVVCIGQGLATLGTSANGSIGTRFSFFNLTLI